jgi:outer membrane protein
MKRTLPVLFLGVALIVFGLMPADAAAPGGVTKIGYVDLERTLRETKAGKQAQRQFDAVKKKKQAALDAKQKSFQKAVAELDRQRLVLKPDVLAKKQKELEKQYVEIQQTYAKLERELNESRVKLIQTILKKAEPAIKSIARKGGYAVILDRSAVVWGHQGVDITSQLNKRLN